MLRMAVVLGLLAISFAYMAESDWSRDYETKVDVLEKHGLTEEAIEALIEVDNDDNEAMENEDYSWEEAKGYEECEEFMFWKKDGWKKGDWEGKKKDWDGEKKDWDGEKKDWDGEQKDRESNDWDKDEGRYKMFGADDEEQYRFDSDVDEDKAGRRRHHRDRHHGHHHHHHHHHHHRCSKPKPLHEICAETECPKFEKLNITGCGFEARRVFAANWTQTPIDISDMASGVEAAFSRLLNYTTGANDQGAHLAMTLPVQMTWLFDEKYQLTAGYMHLYIPSAFQGNPPAPEDDQVSVIPSPDVVTYDRAFGGHRTDPQIYTRQFELLWKGLAQQNITIAPYIQMTAGYTRPGRGRQRMEVAFFAN